MRALVHNAAGMSGSTGSNQRRASQNRPSAARTDHDACCLCEADQRGHQNGLLVALDAADLQHLRRIVDDARGRPDLVEHREPHGHECCAPLVAAEQLANVAEHHDQRRGKRLLRLVSALLFQDRLRGPQGLRRWSRPHNSMPQRGEDRAAGLFTLQAHLWTAHAAPGQLICVVCWWRSSLMATGCACIQRLGSTGCGNLQHIAVPAVTIVVMHDGMRAIVLLDWYRFVWRRLLTCCSGSCSEGICQLKAGGPCRHLWRSEGMAAGGSVLLHGRPEHQQLLLRSSCALILCLPLQHSSHCADPCAGLKTIQGATQGIGGASIHA